MCKVCSECNQSNVPAIVFRSQFKRVLCSYCWRKALADICEQNTNTEKFEVRATDLNGEYQTFAYATAKQLHEELTVVYGFDFKQVSLLSARCDTGIPTRVSNGLFYLTSL